MSPKNREPDQALQSASTAPTREAPFARIGYLVPQFPGQTHIFFWREIAEMEKRGVTPVLFSTRPPPRPASLR